MRRYQRPFLIFIWIINLHTLWLVKPLSENLSYLGNALHMHWYLLLWAASAASYFYIYTRQCMKETHYTNRIAQILLPISCMFMVISVIFPYAPYEYALLSKWHVRIAMASTAVYVLIVFHMFISLYMKEPATYQRTLQNYTTIVMFDLLLYLIHGGVSTLMEITFPMAMSVILRHVPTQ